MRRFLKIIIKLILVVFIFGLPLASMLWVIPTEILFSAEERVSVISLGVSIYSLEMSGVIAFLIYWLQTQDNKYEEKKLREKARCMMYSELENALEGAYMKAAGCGSIGTGVSTKDIMNTYLVELQDILTPDQFRLLISLVNKIDVEANDTSEEQERADTSRNELTSYMHTWVSIIISTSYAQYFSCVKDYRDTLSRPVFELLQVLGGTHEPYVDRKEIYDVNGNVLFRLKGHMEYQIYDGGGKLLLDGKLELDDLDRFTIYDGYECSETYDGYYKDGKYSGQGILYAYEKDKRKEGLWEDGELIKGTEYNRLYEIQPDGSWEFQEPYRDFIEPYFSVKSYMDEDEMKKYRVADALIDRNRNTIELKNVRTLKAFFESLRSE